MLLLDTHAVVWLDTGAPLDEAALTAIEAARGAGGVLVSPVSAWEIGLLVGKGRLHLARDPVMWFERFLAQPGIHLVPLTIRGAVGASFLPGSFHNDPADRLLVATARELGVPLVTRDARIQAYAVATGAVQVVVC
jgi:PIN domain nuclease of toxin-antitoxin system